MWMGQLWPLSHFTLWSKWKWRKAHFWILAPKLFFKIPLSEFGQKKWTQKAFFTFLKFVFSIDCEIVRFVRLSECGVFGNPSCVSYLAKHACPDQYFTCRWLNLKYLKIFAIFRRYGWSNTKSSTMHKSLRKRGRGILFLSPFLQTVN